MLHAALPLLMLVAVSKHDHVLSSARSAAPQSAVAGDEAQGEYPIFKVQGRFFKYLQRQVARCPMDRVGRRKNLCHSFGIKNLSKEW